MTASATTSATASATTSSVSNPPERSTYQERDHLRRLAYEARHLYPGPVGTLIRDEILAWVEFGYRFGNGRLSELVAALEQETLGTRC